MHKLAGRGHGMGIPEGVYPMTTDPQRDPAPTAAPAPPPGTQGPPPGTQGPAPGTQGPAPGSVTPSHHKVQRTRTSGVWVSVAFFAIVLLLLLIFILENGKTVDIAYFGAHGHLPLGVALLLAAVCGVLLVVLAGAARISQLRATARRHRRADSRRAKAKARAAQGPPGP
jgi:lipopolysaccharide assembly protein A